LHRPVAVSFLSHVVAIVEFRQEPAKVPLANMMVYPIYATLQIGKEPFNAGRRYA
jgi:hypothetical protein